MTHNKRLKEHCEDIIKTILINNSDKITVIMIIITKIMYLIDSERQSLCTCFELDERALFYSRFQPKIRLCNEIIIFTRFRNTHEGKPMTVIQSLLR
jgi:hypothetical protein